MTRIVWLPPFVGRNLEQAGQVRPRRPAGGSCRSRSPTRPSDSLRGVREFRLVGISSAPVDKHGAHQTVTSRYGGEGGIRTREAGISRLHTFQACSFNHSDTSPRLGKGGAEYITMRGWNKFSGDAPHVCTHDASRFTDRPSRHHTVRQRRDLRESRRKRRP